MYPILRPRGAGRTYEICEYAVKNNCNILVPMQSTAILCTQDYIKEIAKDLDIQYHRCNTNSQCFTVFLESRERGQYNIRVMAATRLPGTYRGLHLEDKPLVIDDIDRCFQLMIFPFTRIDACSLMTYDPSEVALTPPTALQEAPQNECVCDSLV